MPETHCCVVAQLPDVFKTPQLGEGVCESGCHRCLDVVYGTGLNLVPCSSLLSETEPTVKTSVSCFWDSARKYILLTPEGDSGCLVANQPTHIWVSRSPGCKPPCRAVPQLVQLTLAPEHTTKLSLL